MIQIKVHHILLSLIILHKRSTNPSAQEFKFKNSIHEIMNFPLQMLIKYQLF